MPVKNEITVNLPTDIQSLPETINAIIEQVKYTVTGLNGISIANSFNRNKILVNLGISEERANHIVQNSADSALLKQLAEYMEKELAAVKNDSETQKLKMDAFGFKFEELRRQFSLLTDQQIVTNKEYQEKLADIPRIRALVENCNKKIEQAILDIQDSVRRGMSAEDAAQDKNKALIREFNELKEKIRKLEEEAQKKSNQSEIIDYDEIVTERENNSNDNNLNVTEGQYKQRQELELLNLEWHRKIPPLNEDIKSIWSHIPKKERGLYRKPESKLKNLDYSIIVDNNIKESQFAGQENLLSVVISKGVTSIGENAFFGCKRLIRIFIPDSVKTIGKNAFAYCSKYLKIYFEIVRDSDWYEYKDDWNPHENDIMFGFGTKNAKWVKKLVDFHNLDPFDYLLDEESSSLQYYDIDEDSAILKRYKGRHTKIILPNGIKTIGYYALSGCNSLEDITFSNDIEFIAEDAFYSCKNLKSITLGNKLEQIGYDAFADCTSLSLIIFNGTIAQWRSIKKDKYWDRNTGNYVVKCTDGTFKK